MSTRKITLPMLILVHIQYTVVCEHSCSQAFWSLWLVIILYISAFLVQIPLSTVFLIWHSCLNTSLKWLSQDCHIRGIGETLQTFSPLELVLWFPVVALPLYSNPFPQVHKMAVAFVLDSLGSDTISPFHPTPSAVINLTFTWHPSECW